MSTDTNPSPQEAVMATPLPNLTAEMLRHAWAALVDAPIPAIEVEYEVDGVFVHVTERDLRFIHDADPTRFGGYHECPKCKMEVAA